MDPDKVMLRLIKDFVELLRDTPDLRGIAGYDQAQCVIVGGAAVRCYVKHRTVGDNFDIAVSPPDIAPRIKEKFSTMPYFGLQRDQLYWATTYGSIRIGIIPIDLFPDIPGNLQPIGSLDPCDLPFLPLAQLIQFKAHVCGMRSDKQNTRDADDVQRLLKLFPGQSYRRRLSDRQWASLQLAKSSLKRSKPGYDWDAAI
ncbi:hypothetical protein AbraIFM66951_002901 [Aspergillus brasiliensis]|uniref:Uncharacterized protein n=1 Tax=Aspergillus brasiliensis TaxID=319629 RepID=A0A9W5YU17_9EURO|nr:hypothetical protein AbraCBS73388_010411 [Aspergillus brasiliensis]GKZ50054.1 hypothetical protein AbraIFM66951_002901 [Aspergillus brasiliensis]